MTTTVNKAVLYVGDLSADSTSGDVFRYFGRFGKVIEVDLQKRKSHKLKPYARVTFETEEMGQKAMDTLQTRPAKLNGSDLRIMFFSQQPANKSESNVFFKGLNTEIQQHDLISFCSAFGTVISAKISYDDSGAQRVSKGYGFV
jgi:RNA recognition motif-containing protein